MPMPMTDIRLQYIIARKRLNYQSRFSHAYTKSSKITTKGQQNFRRFFQKIKNKKNSEDLILINGLYGDGREVTVVLFLCLNFGTV